MQLVYLMNTQVFIGMFIWYACSEVLAQEHNRFVKRAVPQFPDNQNHQTISPTNASPATFTQIMCEPPV